MQIYIASGFFTEETRERCKYVAEYLRNNNFKVFLPMEHEIENAFELPNKLWASKVFEMDVEAISNADVVLAFDDGMSGDSGTSWEIGYCFGQQIPCLVVPCAKDISLMTFWGNGFFGCYQNNRFAEFMEDVKHFHQKFSPAGDKLILK